MCVRAEELRFLDDDFEEMLCPVCGNEYEVVLNDRKGDHDVQGFIHCRSCGMRAEI